MEYDAPISVHTEYVMVDSYLSMIIIYCIPTLPPKNEGKFLGHLIAKKD